MTENTKSSNLKDENNEETIPLTQDQYDMDVAWRFFFREMGKKDLVKIINTCTKSQLPLDVEVEFLDTSGRTALGPSAFYSREQDLVLSVKEKDKAVQKISIELQTYHDPEFSMRLFAYGFNTAEKTKKNRYVFQKSCTFYLTTGKIVHGHDEFEMEDLDFYVKHQDGTVSSGKAGDVLCVRFPFINLLAMDWKELTSKDYALLQTLYAYRYVMNPNLIKNDKKIDFSTVIQEIEQFISHLEDEETRKSQYNMYQHLLKRIIYLCERKSESFEEELKFMTTTFVDIFALEKQSIEKGREEGRQESREEAHQEGRQECMLEIIANTIRKGMDKSEILQLLDCSEELYQKAYEEVHSI